MRPGKSEGAAGTGKLKETESLKDTERCSEGPVRPRGAAGNEMARSAKETPRGMAGGGGDEGVSDGWRLLLMLKYPGLVL